MEAIERRVLTWLAATILSAIAAGEACAQAKGDPLCSTKTKSLEQRIDICTRYIDKTALVYNTGPWVARVIEATAGRQEPYTHGSPGGFLLVAAK